MILYCDASSVAMGSVLSQIKDGKERVIAHYSKAFKTEERNYCVTRRELLGVVTALKHFEPYLLFTKFAVRTDHSSLRSLKSLKNPEQQLFRWLAAIQAFNFHIFYRPGKDHGNADSLSRRPCDPECKHCKRREQATWKTMTGWTKYVVYCGRDEVRAAVPRRLFYVLWYFGLWNVLMER